MHFSHVSSPKGALTVSQDLMLHLQPPELRAFSSNHAPDSLARFSEKFPPIPGGGGGELAPRTSANAPTWDAQEDISLILRLAAMMEPTRAMGEHLARRRD